MARSAAVAVENSFVKGLITEATGLNFPEQACTETYDCIFNEKGEVSRRLGFDLEDSYSLNTVGTTLTDLAIEYFVWENVAGRGDLTFVVIQVGGTLYFFGTSSSGALSANQLFTVTLSTYAVSGAPTSSGTECTFASGNGVLFVTHPYLETFYITYDADLLTHTQTQITLKIRDFKGVDDTLDPDTRPTTLSTLHKYNLYNQGWYSSAPCDTGGATATGHDSGTQNVLTYFHTRNSPKYPSNSDVWWVLKSAYDVFAPDDPDRIARGNTQAPKGHYLLNALYQDRSTASGLAGLTVTSSGYQRPSAVAFHSSRVFYGGVQAANYSNHIYFSQIVKDEQQYGKCYQTEDPTAEDLSDLLPTDGGEIVVLEAGTLYKLVSVQNFLLAFFSNGVWSISGSQGQAFAANDYSVAKVSDVPTQSSQAFVIVNGYPVWWTSDGIYTVVFDQITSSLSVKTLTDKTIKSFYDAIPATSKSHAKGAYNSRTKVIQWTYRSSTGSGTSDYHKHDRVLCYNTLTESFYPWQISQPSETTGPWVSGVFSTKGLGIVRQDAAVTTNAGVAVVDSLGIAVTASSTTTQYLTSTFKYVTILKDGSNYKLSFAEEGASTYLDWPSVTSGTDYTSYALSGYKIHGNAINKFQANWIEVYMITEANAAAYIQPWWDYASSTDSGKIGQSQGIYKDDDNFSVSRKRLKIRGEGTALQFKFFSETGKPFTLLGWATFETGNTSP